MNKNSSSSSAFAFEPDEGKEPLFSSPKYDSVLDSRLDFLGKASPTNTIRNFAELIYSLYDRKELGYATKEDFLTVVQLTRHIHKDHAIPYFLLFLLLRNKNSKGITALHLKELRAVERLWNLSTTLAKALDKYSILLDATKNRDYYYQLLNQKLKDGGLELRNEKDLEKYLDLRLRKEEEEDYLIRLALKREEDSNQYLSRITLKVTSLLHPLALSPFLPEPSEAYPPFLPGETFSGEKKEALEQYLVGEEFSQLWNEDLDSLVREAISFHLTYRSNLFQGLQFTKLENG